MVGSAALTQAGSNATAAQTSAAEPLLSYEIVSYEIDRMFRAVRRPPTSTWRTGVRKRAVSF